MTIFGQLKLKIKMLMNSALELQKLNRCKEYLKSNGVFDQDSFVELTSE